MLGNGGLFVWSELANEVRGASQIIDPTLTRIAAINATLSDDKGLERIVLKVICDLFGLTEIGSPRKGSNPQPIGGKRCQQPATR